jgi:hypothetical protein
MINNFVEIFMDLWLSDGTHNFFSSHRKIALNECNLFPFFLRLIMTRYVHYVMINTERDLWCWR